MKNNMKIKNQETNETIYTTYNTLYHSECYSSKAGFNRQVRAAESKDGFVCSGGIFDTIKNIAISRNEITTEQAVAEHIELMSDWHNHPATSRQREYLAKLGIFKAADDPTLTKGQASELINVAKEGAGSLGYDEGTTGQNLMEPY